MDNILIALAFMVGFVYMYNMNNKSDYECEYKRKNKYTPQKSVTNNFTDFGAFILDVGGTRFILEKINGNWFSCIINEEDLEKFSKKYGYGNKKHKNYHNPNKLKTVDVKTQNKIVELYGVLVNISHADSCIVLRLCFDSYNIKE